MSVPVKVISSAVSAISAALPSLNVSPLISASTAVIVVPARVSTPASPVPLKAEMLISLSCPSVISGALISTRPPAPLPSTSASMRALVRSNELVALKIISPPSPLLKESFSMVLPPSILIASPLKAIEPPMPAPVVLALTATPRQESISPLIDICPASPRPSVCALIEVWLRPILVAWIEKDPPAPPPKVASKNSVSVMLTFCAERLMVPASPPLSRVDFEETSTVEPSPIEIIVAPSKMSLPRPKPSVSPRICTLLKVMVGAVS